MKTLQQISRRTFVAGSVTSSIASSMFAAARRPEPRVVGANERLHVGVIGAGGNANGHMRKLLQMKRAENVEIVAVSDIYQKRLDEAAALTGARPFKDYRKLLEQREIDYVVISTPEHWHYQMILDAADAGKHIYCEKPLTYSIEEGLKVVKRIKESKIKMQVGVQGMSDDSYETAQRYIQSGALGKVVMAQIDYSRNYVEDFWLKPADEDVRPGENLDWDAFLGPAKRRPFEPDRFFSWRRYWDYCGGIATDLFVHRITRIIKACNLTTPSRVVATGGKWFFRDSPAEIPDTFTMVADYPEGITVVLVSSMANGAKVRHLIRGREATLEFTEEGFVIEPEKEFAEGRKPILHEKTGDEDVAPHHQNHHRAIRLGEPLKCDVDLGFYGMMACRMAVESYREKKYLAWDARREKVVEA